MAFDLTLYFGEHILGIVSIDSFDISEKKETISITSTITPESNVMTNFSASYVISNTPVQLSGTVCFVAEAYLEGVSCTYKMDEDLLI